MKSLKLSALAPRLAPRWSSKVPDSWLRESEVHRFLQTRDRVSSSADRRTRSALRLCGTHSSLWWDRLRTVAAECRRSLRRLFRRSARRSPRGRLPSRL